MSRTRKLVEEEIIRIATECFNERGYQATTIEEIAARVDISRVTFYTYFENKETLLQTIFERGLSAYQQGVEAILATPLSHRETLRRIVAHQVASLTAEQPAIRIFLGEEKTLPSRLAQQIQAVYRQVDRLLEQEIRKGIEAGEFIDTQPRLLMYAFMGMCNWLYRWYRPDGPFTPELIVETFSRLLESGCLRSEAKVKDLSTPERLQHLEEGVDEIKEDLKKMSRQLRLETERPRLNNNKRSSGKNMGG